MESDISLKQLPDSLKPIKPLDWKNECDCINARWGKTSWSDDTVLYEDARFWCQEELQGGLQYLLQKNILHRIFDLFMILDNNKTNAHEKSLTHILSLIALLLNQLKKGIENSTPENKKKLTDYYSFFTSPQFILKIIDAFSQENKHFHDFSTIN